jgi:hypothetical protein
VWLLLVIHYIIVIARPCPSARRRWLGTALDGQTDCVKTYRNRQSVANPFAVCWLGTALDGQTDCVKTNRIRLSVVNRSAVIG